MSESAPTQPKPSWISILMADDDEGDCGPRACGAFALLEVFGLRGRAGLQQKNRIIEERGGAGDFRSSRMRRAGVIFGLPIGC